MILLVFFFFLTFQELLLITDVQVYRLGLESFLLPWAWPCAHMVKPSRVDLEPWPSSSGFFLSSLKRKPQQPFHDLNLSKRAPRESSLRLLRQAVAAFLCAHLHGSLSLLGSLYPEIHPL